MSTILKLLLAAIFFICLLKMPYGYYQLVRFAALVVFLILAYLVNQNGSQVEMIIYIGLAVLFQPLFKIALGRQVWNIVDVIVAIGLIVSVFDPGRKPEKTTG